MNQVKKLLDKVIRRHPCGARVLQGLYERPSPEELMEIMGDQGEAQLLLDSIGGWERVVAVARADAEAHVVEWHMLTEATVLQIWRRFRDQPEAIAWTEKRKGFEPGGMRRVVKEIPVRLTLTLLGDEKRG